MNNQKFDKYLVLPSYYIRVCEFKPRFFVHNCLIKSDQKRAFSRCKIKLTYLVIFCKTRKNYKVLSGTIKSNYLLGRCRINPIKFLTLEHERQKINQKKQLNASQSGIKNGDLVIVKLDSNKGAGVAKITPDDYIEVFWDDGTTRLCYPHQVRKIEGGIGND